MRDLQIAGIFVSVLVSFYGMWKYKRGVFTRLPFFIFEGLAVALFIISISPSAVDLIAKPLQMERWNSVLFLSVLILVGLFFYSINIGNGNNRTISRLIQSLAYLRSQSGIPKPSPFRNSCGNPCI